MTDKLQKYERFKLAVKQWKDNNLNEFNDYCEKIRDLDGTEIMQTSKKLYTDCPKFFKAWSMVANDESFSDYDAIVAIVSHSDFAASIVKRFEFPEGDITIPLFVSWLYYANSFEIIVQLLSNQVDAKTNFLQKKMISFSIKKAIEVSIKQKYRTEEQRYDYMSIEEDTGNDSFAVNILRKRFARKTENEIALIEKAREERPNIINNFYSQQNIAIHQSLSLQQNILNHIVFVYEEPATEEQSEAKKDADKPQEPLMIEYKIPEGAKKLADFIINVDNVDELMSRISEQLHKNNKGSIYAYIKIILEEKNLLQAECSREVKSFYDALLQFEGSDIKFLSLLSVQKSYKRLMETIRIKNGEAIAIKDQESERILIDKLAQDLFSVS